MEDKKIIVIPTKTIPQGITALINYIPDSTPEENAERMSEETGDGKDRSGDLCGARYRDR